MDVDKKFPEGMRVLAVDDNQCCLKITEMLLQICKYDVTAVLQAEVALEILRARKDTPDQFDVVITDVDMPGMDGFKLLEHIRLEMNIPVIMLSANDELESMMKGIKQGACDYLVKPVRLEKMKRLWMHVVKNGINGGNGDAVQQFQPGDADGEKECAKKTRKYGTEVDNVNISTQKRKRFQWSCEQHRKFVEIVNRIGIDRAVPKQILQMMNVRGLNRKHVASHLQKYRTYMKKVSRDTFRLSNQFANEHAWNNWPRINLNNEPESSTRKPELKTYQAPPAFPGSPNSSSKPFAWLNFKSAFGTSSSLLPTQSVQPMSTQKNLVIAQHDMGPGCQGGSLLKDAAAPGPQQDASRQFITFDDPRINMSGGSQMFPSGPSSSSSANSSDGIEFINTSKSSPSGSSGIRSANISEGRPPQVKSNGLSSYASTLHRKLMGANRGIPVDDDDFFGSIADGGMLSPMSPLAAKSPDLANQHSVQLLPSSADKIATGPLRLTNNGETAVPPKLDDPGHKDGTFEGPSQGNDLTVYQLLEFQNQMDTVLSEEDTPMVDFSYQMALVNLESNRNSIVIPDDNRALGSGEGANGNLPANDSTDALHAVAELNNSNEPLVAAGEAHEMSGDFLDDFLMDFDNDFFITNDAFMDGDFIDP